MCTSVKVYLTTYGFLIGIADDTLPSLGTNGQVTSALTGDFNRGVLGQVTITTSNYIRIQVKVLN